MSSLEDRFLHIQWYGIQVTFPEVESVDVTSVASLEGVSRAFTFLIMPYPMIMNVASEHYRHIVSSAHCASVGHDKLGQTFRLRFG